MTAETRANEFRSLHALLRYHEPDRTPFRRITPAMRADLLEWAATLSDEELLDMRNIGKTLLRWIREHQAADQAAANDSQAAGRSTFGEVIKATGWRVELFWNGAGGWFTARMVSPWNRDGVRIYPGGYLVPFDDPIGASGATPEEAVANLSEAVLEWA
jgi:hypothetical protein